MKSIIQIYENETGNKMPTNYLGFLEWHKDYIKWLELSLSILIFCNDQKICDECKKLKSNCPKCKFEPMIKVDEKYNCEMCGYVDGQTVA